MSLDGVDSFMLDTHQATKVIHENSTEQSVDNESFMSRAQILPDKLLHQL